MLGAFKQNGIHWLWQTYYFDRLNIYCRKVEYLPHAMLCHVLQNKASLPCIYCKLKLIISACWTLLLINVILIWMDLGVWQRYTKKKKSEIHKNCICFLKTVWACNSYIGLSCYRFSWEPVTYRAIIMLHVSITKSVLVHCVELYFGKLLFKIWFSIYVGK